MTIENMKNIQTINGDVAELEKLDPAGIVWIQKLKELSLFNVRNEDIIIKSILEARELQAPLPFILTFCPAIKNLDIPNSKSQTRRLMPLTTELPRAKMAIEELIGFLVFTKNTLGITPNVFLVFADSVEKGAENMFENLHDMNIIAEQSVRGIQQLFKDFDLGHPGFIQQNGIQIPKVRRQSSLNIEANKVGKSRKEIIEDRETEMFDPTNPLFQVWEKHLLLTRQDQNFVATGWQSKKGAEALWNRVRFLLAEFMADGEILPKLAKLTNPKKFTNGFPNPIFIVSTTRLAGFEMEVDGFNTAKKIGVIAPFHNIGRWTDQENNSPWLNFLI